MKPDIENIIAEVRSKIPDVNVVQLEKTLPADDDGLWWFRLPGIKKNIQIESSTGNCPCLIESDDDRTPADAFEAKTVDEVVARVSYYLNSQRRS